ncbi:adenylate cyclase type 10 [Erythrolamprus reginae]|uniref:adenylate cyclase type 10 n=1 Tax=Erythrolamprus reginae TaxID=121349 RepID=UPI00396CEE3E
MTNKNDQIEISALGKLAAHVPDVIVYGDFAQEMPFIESFDGVLLFMDISGFTALTEKFSMNTSLDRGADELTQTLNHYMGDIVEEVLVFGGDVLKFAGDALLALWKVERCHLNEIITLALKCSFSIQQEYGVRDTEVGLELRVKIGLSAGHISKVVIGDNRRQHFVVTGRAVEEVRLAQNLAKAGEIIMSPNCWELCDRNLIEVEKIKNERAVKVKYIRNAPDFDADEFFNRCAYYLNQNHICNSFEVLRIASVLGPDEELEKRLRKYVMKNVLKKIDDNQPLEYLSELRPVTIVFVNMQFEENANIHHVCKAIQDANAMITGTILPLRGNINKVFMFDKGCTVLCIFGLPGDKQADESTNALDSAHKIHAFCSTALMKVKIVSIGVTGGPVFCGVVGHRVRHEYTVIGRKVNLAARLMMFYPGIVSCDALTYSKSKLPHYFFEELPLVEMKGVVNPGTVYQFLGITEKAMIYKAYLTKERSEFYPLLGRNKETDIFENLLEKFKETKLSHIIIYEGLMGYGKSQLITEIAYLGQAPGQKVVAMELTKINAWQNFFTVRTLMAMFLGVDVCKTYDARQYILLSKLRGVIEEQYLCLFNNFFHVKFPTSEVISQMGNDRKNKEIETMLLKILINAAEKEVLIFAIDEAQFIDKASWDFLDNLLKSVPIFVVMALSPINHKGRIVCSSAANILNSPSTTFIQLRELSPSIIIQKACQDLGVVSITRELETFLIQRSHGNPFYCEELLRNLHLNNVLQFHLLEEDEEKEDEWDRLFTTTVLKTHGSKMLDEETELYICTIGQNVKLTAISLPPTLKGIALAALDNMNPSEQMVVKCAAVIGVTFTTEMLLYILPEWTKRKMYQTLAALVESHIFKCCSERKEVNVTQRISNNELKSLRQESDLGSVISNRLKLEEAVMHCKIMEFCTPLLQEAAYELWLKNQKKALHFKCASYLKWLAHRCKCCGEGDFIPYHRYAVDGMLQKFYSQEYKIKDIKEDVLNEAAVILVSETLKKLEASHQEGAENQERKGAFSLSHKKGLFRKREKSDYSFFFSARHPSVAALMESSGDTLIEWKDNRIKTRQLTSGDTLWATCILQESFRAENSELEFLKRMDEIILLTGMRRQRTKTPSSQDCECKEIVESVAVPLSQHYLALGDYSRAFYYLLECASAYVNLSHNYMAFTYLNTAESLLRSSEYKHKLINQFEVSVLYSLKGEVCYNMGLITSAKKLIKKALRLLKKSFPITVVGAFCMFMVETSKHLSRQNKQTLWQISSGREKRLAVLFQQGHCLSLLWQLFNLDVARSRKTFTRLAALMQVNCAEESQDESQIILSYMDFSLCYQMMGCQHEWMKYELMAIKRSSHLQVVGGGLLTIAKLASSLVYMKLCLGNIPLAIQLGYRAHKLYEQLKRPNFDAIVLYDIFKALYLSTRYQDSIQVLSCLEELTFQDDNIIGQSLFISGCLNIILYAGFCFKPFRYCQDFILTNETNCILMSQNNIMLSLYSSLAIWFARLQQWDKFIIPFEKARRLVRRTCASLCSNHGFCKLVECETLLLRKYIEERPDKVREMHSRITKNLDQIMSQCSISPVYYSRVYHLKAYVQLMLGNDELSQSFLEKGFYSSDIYGNRLERSWLEISKEWWFTGKKPMEDFWLKAVPDFPVWNVNTTAQEMGTFHKNMYLLKVPELDISNPFPESSIEELQ